ncbi:MAG: hypothetical protein MK081_15670 [Flavobacteriales bacterium]|nr:hypothetical protein [Flavobacteriales bacterium]
MLASAKYRFYLLAGGLFLFLILAWNLSISKSFEVNRQNKELQEVASQGDQINTGIQIALMEKSQLETMAGSMEGDAEENRNALLNVVDSLMQEHQCELKGIEPLRVFSTGGFEVFLNSITLTGDYVSLLQICQHLEFNASHGKMVSTQFERVKNRTNRKYELHATFTIQSIRAAR